MVSNRCIHIYVYTRSTIEGSIAHRLLLNECTYMYSAANHVQEVQSNICCFTIDDGEILLNVI